MNRILVIYCPDCRGKFEIEHSDIEEDEILECSLCGAEIKVICENPIRLKLYCGDDDF